MIELHRKGRRDFHILCDDGGWESLKEAARSGVLPDVPGLDFIKTRAPLGWDVFRTDRNGCPCDPYPKVSDES